MGTWNTDTEDTDHAKYLITASLDGVTSCHFQVVLVSDDMNGTFVEADAENVIDAVLAALGTDPDIAVLFKTRSYTTSQSYTP